jgi:hypothetical protein
MKRLFNGFIPFYNADNGAGEGGSGDAGEGKPPKVEFTAEQQAELNRVIADRVDRERKKFADYDAMKTKLTALEQAEAEREAAKLSDTERLEAEKATALAAAEDAKAERDKALTTANQRLINAEFKALAREANVPAERLAAALKLADLAGVTVDDNGDVVGAKGAVEALVAAHSYLVEKTQAKTIGGASGGKADPPDKTKEQLLKEAADKARISGRLEDRAAYAALKDELSK